MGKDYFNYIGMKIKVLDQSFANVDYTNKLDMEYLSVLSETEKTYKKILKGGINIDKNEESLM